MKCILFDLVRKYVNVGSIGLCWHLQPERVVPSRMKQMIMTVGQSALGAAHERSVAPIPEDKQAVCVRPRATDKARFRIAICQWLMPVSPPIWTLNSPNEPFLAHSPINPRLFCARLPTDSSCGESRHRTHRPSAKTKRDGVDFWVKKWELRRGSRPRGTSKHSFGVYHLHQGPGRVGRVINLTNYGDSHYTIQL